MRSVRLDPVLDEQVRRAAQEEGVTVSEFIREAVAERAARTTGGHNRERLSDVIGMVNGSSPQARRTGEAFSELLDARRRRA